MYQLADDWRRRFHELRDGQTASGQRDIGHHFRLLGRLHHHRRQTDRRETDAMESDARSARPTPQTLYYYSILSLLI